MTRHGPLAALLSITALCVAPAVAHAEPRTFTLDYAARGDCPSEVEVLRQFRDRAPAAERVRADGALNASMRVNAGAGEAQGDIEWRRGDTVVHRSITGADCSEVVAALALILALAFDSGDESNSAKVPERAVAATPQTARAWHPVFAVIGGATSGIGPKPRAYYGARGGLFRRTGGAWAPRAELSAVHATATSRTALGSADLSLWTARLAACPFELADRRWYARPCASFDVGRLSARGYRTKLARSAAAAWYGPGVLLAAGMRVVGPLAFGVEGGAVFPLARDRFYFEPDQTAARIPSAAGYCGISLGVEP